MSIRKEQKEGSSIIYLIDEENKTVTAKIPANNAYLSVRYDCHKHHFAPYGMWSVEKEDRRNYIIGKAVCAPEDTFDVEVGKKLARVRALKKFYAIKMKAFDTIAAEYDGYLRAIEDYMNYSWLRYNDNLEIEKEICGAKEEEV